MPPKIDAGLRKLFIQHITGVHWQAIETGGTGRGVPDLNGCKIGKEIWIECKQTEHWSVVIRPEQVGWIERRTRVGGVCFVAVRRALDELWLLAPSSARTLATPRSGLKQLDGKQIIGVWTGGPASWPWNRVEFELFRPT